MTTLLEHRELQARFDVRLLNTTRAAERKAGTLSGRNLQSVAVDVVRTFRAARGAAVVHVQTALMPTWPLLRALALCTAGRAGGAAVVCHVHSGRVNSGQAEAFSPTRLQRALLGLLGVAHVVLTVSRPGAAALQPLVRGTRVEPVDNAVDTADFTPAALDGSPPVLLYVGTLSERKGLADLVRALALMEQRGATPYLLRIVGGPAEVGEDEAERLRRAVRGAGHADALLGTRTPEQVRQHLQEADLFVLPSHWEGQPIAILEAMATGLPVVVTAVGANPDVVRDGVDGRVVAPHDPVALAAALEELLRDGQARRRAGAAARERVVDRHDVARLGRRMAELYDELAPGPP